MASSSPSGARPASSPRANKLSAPSSGSMSASPPLIGWLRRSFFGSSLPASVSLAHATGHVEEEEEEEEYAESTECPICTTESKMQLSFSLPCRHYACDRCWLSWTKQQQHGSKDKQTAMHCLICNQTITSIKYVKTKIQPSLGSSSGSGALALKRADDLFEDTLRLVLGVKNDLDEVKNKLQSTETHLGFLHEAAQLGELDQDALVSIVQVEMVLIKEQLSSLLRIASEQIALLPESLSKLNQSMHELLREVHSIMRSDSVDTVNNRHSSIRLGVEHFASMLETEHTASRHTTLKVQWDQVFTLLAGLLDSAVVNVILFMVPSEANSLLKLMDKTKQKLSAHLPAITANGTEFEQLAVRYVDRVHDEQVL
ncbi:hypothetical protein BASA81_003368 [Batrachochytrium salamandrivorans]|nr:hypothetical protein BASA81_003368 [Batrachochytrium salamandrivorans]